MPFYQTITEPAIEPVTLAEAKGHAIVDDSLGTDDDDFISSLIVAAREHVELLTRLALITRTERLTLDAWGDICQRTPAGGYAQIDRGPFQAVTAVNTIDEDGDRAEMSAGEYYSNPNGGGGVLAPKGGYSLPTPSRIAGGIEIDFTRGYGDTAVDVPEALRRAVMMLVAHWYEHREAVAVDADARPAISAGVPNGFDQIIGQYRKLRVI